MISGENLSCLRWFSGEFFEFTGKLRQGCNEEALQRSMDFLKLMTICSVAAGGERKAWNYKFQLLENGTENANYEKENHG